MKGYGLVHHALLGVLGVLYALLLVAGAYASVEALIAPSWHFLVAFPLATVGWLGFWNVAKVLAGGNRN